jgi:hypothetical protein
MDRVTRRWLSKAPVLLTAYLVWRNRTARWGPRAGSAALALPVAWVAAVSIWVRVDRSVALSSLERLQRHDLLLSAISAIVAAVLVARRRALKQLAAARSWTAALPIDGSIAQWQALAVGSAPALVLACVLTAMFGGSGLVALVDGSMPVSMVTWAAMTASVLVGAGLGHLLPAARQDEMYEGSRYVPHRRRTQASIPIGTLAALGSWPMRQMFANARPKTIARTILPILLCVPLGSTAADAMLAIGLLTAIGALVLLVAAVISVGAKASRWLRPLPLGPRLLARRIMSPTLAFMLCVTAVESWLIWVLGSPVVQCIAAGVLTLAAGTILALVGSLFAICATNKANSD